MKEAQRGGLCGRNQNGDSAGSEFVERGGALLLHVRMGREVLERKHVVRGQADHTLGIDGSGEFAAGAQSRFKSLGGLVVGHYDDNGMLGGAGKQRKVQRTGSIGESGHTSSSDTEGEVPANAIKGGGLLQFRENFADKREDHAVSSLPVDPNGLQGTAN